MGWWYCDPTSSHSVSDVMSETLGPRRIEVTRKKVKGIPEAGSDGCTVIAHSNIGYKKPAFFWSDRVHLLPLGTDIFLKDW